MFTFHHFVEALEPEQVLLDRVLSGVGSDDLKDEILRDISFRARLKRRVLAAAGINQSDFDALPTEARAMLCILTKEPKRIARICGLVFHPRLIRHSIEPGYASVLTRVLSKEDFWAAARLSQKNAAINTARSTGVNYTPSTAVELIEQTGIRCLLRWSTVAGDLDNKILKCLFPAGGAVSQDPSGELLIDQLVVWFAIDQVRDSKQGNLQAA